MTKTNAMHILEKSKIPYTTVEYEDNTEHGLELGAANRAAEKTGLDAACVFKTIVMQSESKEIRVFCIPANKEVNLKKARSICGAKSIESVKPDSLLQLTGYVRGGRSPIGMKRRYPTFIDASALTHETVYVSAGGGIQLGLSPESLIQAYGVQSADLTLG